MSRQASLTRVSTRSRPKRPGSPSSWTTRRDRRRGGLLDPRTRPQRGAVHRGDGDRDARPALRRELEFVFADGGSSDRTREILGELAREDPRVRLSTTPEAASRAGSMSRCARRVARGRHEWTATRCTPLTTSPMGSAGWSGRQPVDLRAPACPRPQPGVTARSSWRWSPRWVAADRGSGPRPPAAAARPATSSNWTPGCSVASGGARPSWTTAAGTSAGTRTRTRSSRRGSCAAASG